ncbi:MAG TPA: pyridoxal-phosphate dependent enzyme, partial [Pseudonocardiaceae bacterium]|nr:pyridoxal-phosphate dependent enzyme [Pseudonocardiaceae bacterium]
MATSLTPSMIEQAVQRLRPVVRRTPLEANERLSDLLGCPVLLKREDSQLCRSYKVRGAFNLISALSPADQRNGVVCASAGNHGQGVAFACRRLGIRGRIFLPANTPRQKRERIAVIGGDRVDVVVVGSTYDEASSAARWDSERTGAVYA